jgi:hypothetical protein
MSILKSIFNFRNKNQTSDIHHQSSLPSNPTSDIRHLTSKVRQIEIKTKGLSNHIFSGEYHTDFKETHTVLLYSVNTNNGYTKFENDKKIISEENKLIIFNSNVKHTGTTCTDSDYRIVINFNYFENETK